MGQGAGLQDTGTSQDPETWELRGIASLGLTGSTEYPLISSRSCLLIVLRRQR